MLCRVEMVNDEQRFGRFYRWRLLHTQGGMKNIMILMAALLVFVAVTMMLSGASPLFLLLIVGVFVGYMLYAFFAKPNSIFRKRPGAAMETEVFIFTENGFQRNVKNEESGSNEHSSSQYDVLVSAAETSKDFLLFISPSQGYTIDKEAFTNGTPDELRDILQRKMGKKFKTKKKA